MSLPTGDRGSGSGSGDPNQSGRQQPLFILSSEGKHTDESRRLVRAQAARASAAQSRVTRARNRGERDGSVQSPVSDEGASSAASPSGLPLGNAAGRAAGVMPLAAWLPCIVGGATGAVAQQASGMATSVGNAVRQPTSIGLSQASALSAPGFNFRSSDNSGGEAVQSPGEESRLQLPIALPKGFTVLQSKIPVSAGMLSLLSRTACIDFASPGAEQRLHQLLFDLIVSVAGSALTPDFGHPLQGHLRVACTCLTIFQGQRANGQVFAHDAKYQVGLEAAWSEATMLDKAALDEPKSAEASLWAVFIIIVTTGATANFFHNQLQGLLRDLQLQYWSEVRKVLLDFIYPVSFLDAPCKSFYESLQSIQAVAG
jgi:hypothetical protein